MYKTTSRDDLKLLLAKVESLAKEAQSKLDSGRDHLNQCNELSCSMMTMVFCLGEVYALEQEALRKTNNVTTKKAVVASKYNVRDSYGRFASSKPTQVKAYVASVT